MRWDITMARNRSLNPTTTGPSSTHHAMTMRQARRAAGPAARRGDGRDAQQRLALHARADLQQGLPRGAMDGRWWPGGGVPWGWMARPGEALDVEQLTAWNSGKNSLCFTEVCPQF